ncbi:MAG TPA: DUF1015 domain-containing protein [Candidatus Limnocylindrales bacterium]|nr:DUF1015 domain-containing protein [Candidatus Limnocylindrales bacterium]
MPVVRPFRALRYDPSVAGPLEELIAPPYDVVSPTEREELLGRSPRNVIRVELPAAEPGEEPDAKYRHAARTLAAWRSDGTLRKDPRPSLYVYEESYCPPGSETPRSQRGVFCRLRLEPFGPGSGVRPHERTLSGPKEDRYRLLRATGTNTSPVVGLFDDASGRVGSFVERVVAGTPAADATDDDGVRHRLWAVAEADDAEFGAVADALGAGPITIADGHHRYETALRYRDERRMTRSCEEDPAFDYVLALLLEASQQLTILPTHRIVQGLSAAEQGALRGRLLELFEVEDGGRSVSARDLAAGWLARFETEGGGQGLFGFLGPDGALVVRARRAAFEPLLAAVPPAVRGLDVTLLGVALERLLGIGPAQVAEGRVAYTHDAGEAAAAVGAAGDVAFLLAPTPVRAVIDVAAAGAVMPQKSTYFYPKAVTGLVLNPHEW